MAWVSGSQTFRARHKYALVEHLATQFSNSICMKKSNFTDVFLLYAAKFVSNVNNVIFFKYIRYRQTQTNSDNVESIPLRFGSPRCDTFFDTSPLLFESRPMLD